jgi:hypothetical protein
LRAFAREFWQGAAHGGHARLWRWRHVQLCVALSRSAQCWLARCPTRGRWIETRLADRSGTFDAGYRYTPKDDLDAALARALKWLPKAKDKSNGWTFTHPFEKMNQYQRALFWRHLFPFVWPDAEASEPAQELAIAKADACADEDEEGKTAWLRMAGLVEEAPLVEAPPTKRQRAA